MSLSDSGNVESNKINSIGQTPPPELRPPSCGYDDHNFSGAYEPPRNIESPKYGSSLNYYPVREEFKAGLETCVRDFDFGFDLDSFEETEYLNGYGVRLFNVAIGYITTLKQRDTFYIRLHYFPYIEWPHIRIITEGKQKDFFEAFATHLFKWLNRVWEVELPPNLLLTTDLAGSELSEEEAFKQTLNDKQRIYWEIYKEMRQRQKAGEKLTPERIVDEENEKRKGTRLPYLIIKTFTGYFYPGSKSFKDKYNSIFTVSYTHLTLPTT